MKTVKSLSLVSLLVVAVMLLAACPAPAPSVVEKVVTQIVEQQKVVEETVVVEVAKKVEVVQTQVVEKQVEVVVPTPEPTATPTEEPLVPESQLPPPDSCDPAKPALDSVEVVHGPEVGQYDKDIYTMEAKYTNAKWSQEFLLTASSQNPETMDSIVRGLKVCYEVLDTGIPEPSDANSDTSEAENLKRALDFLHCDPSNILFEFQLAPTDKFKSENVVVVYFAVDPIMDADRVDDFRAKCCYSARISVGVSNNGSAFARLYRAGSSVDTTTTAMAGSLSDIASHDNGNTRTTYDARVYGSKGTSYWVTGAWTKSGSKISTNVCP